MTGTTDPHPMVGVHHCDVCGGSAANALHRDRGRTDTMTAWLAGHLQQARAYVFEEAARLSGPAGTLPKPDTEETS